MRSIAALIIIFACIYVSCAQNQTQTADVPKSPNSPEPTGTDTAGAYSIVERANWHRYINGTYVGLISQETRATIIPRQQSGVLLHQGNFFVLQSMIHQRPLGRTVDAIIPVSYQLFDDGYMLVENDQGFPRMRGFPSFPAQQIRPGTRWSAPGVRASDPFNTGQPLLIPFVAEYEYRGVEIFRDELVHRLFATFASSYTNNEAIDGELARIRGGHRVDILIRVKDNLPVFMRDNFDVTYTKADNSSVRLRGFTLTFGSRTVLMDRGNVIAALGDTLNIKNLPDPDALAAAPAPIVTVPQPGPTEAEDRLPELQEAAIDMAPVPEGIRLTIRNIQFAPDSAEFLPAERARLDLIAEALKQIPERTFLVEGHTAATGRPAGEMTLSIQRAQRMIYELVRRGISPNRFIYKGWGGTRPIGNNATSEGRSANRRVEITILE